MKKIVIISLMVTLSFAQSKLKISQKAPEITAEDIYGQKVVLSELTRTQKILVTFQRYASCPVCNYRIRELYVNYDKLTTEGIEVVMFIESSKSNILKNLQDIKIPFHIIADPEGKFYKMYGVEKNTVTAALNYTFHPVTNKLIKDGEKFVNKEVKQDGSMKRIEAEFLVNMLGKITMAHYGSYIGDFLTLDKVKSTLVRD